MAVASQDEPILSRLDRLDIMMGYLEELRGCHKSAKSSSPSTPSSGALTSDGGNSSVNSSPKSLEKRCRPVDAVILEAQVKGTLVDRLVQLENRVLKLSMKMEEEMEEEKRRADEEKNHKRAHKKSLKRLVKSCVKGKSKGTED